MGEQGGGQAGGHFERFNALIRNGWMRKGVLSETELKVWLVYEMHAKPDGSEARPSVKTIAAHVGHAYDGHVRMARNFLARCGLLSREDDKVGGRTLAAVRTLVPPKNAARLARSVRKAMADERRSGAERSAPERSAVERSAAERAPSEQAGCSGGARPGCSNGARPNKDEQTHEQTHKPQNAAGAAAGTPAGVKRKRKPRVLTDEQQRMRIEFSDWWMSAAWPRFHSGQTYGFEGDRDGPAVLRLLRHPKVKWDLERAKSIGLYYLRLQDSYLVHLGKPLPTLAQRVNYYASKLDQLSQQGSSHVLGIADPGGDGGRPAGDGILIPTGRRVAGGAGPRAGEGGAAAAAG